MVKHPFFVVFAVTACISSGLYLDSSYVEIFGSVMGVINVCAMMLVVYAMSGLYVMMVLKVINMCISFDGYLEWRRNYYQNEQKQVSLEVA